MHREPVRSGGDKTPSGTRDTAYGADLAHSVTAGEPVRATSNYEWPVDRDSLVARAKRLHAERRARHRFFSPKLFGEPAWEILLALYYLEGREQLTVSRLSLYANVPMASAVRWLKQLAADGLVQLAEHAHDRRVTIIMITDKSRTAMDQFFHALLHA